jgi:hypothetical protein
MDYYDKIVNVKEYIHRDSLKTICNFCITNFGIYMLWVTIHYIAAHLYVYWCVPATIVGIIMSPFLVPAPHCYGLRWAVYHGGNSIIAMWTIIGVWLLARILPLKTE